MNGPFTLITGRTRAQGNGLHHGRDSETYRLATQQVEMNEADLVDLGLDHASQVRITTPAGSVQVPVRVGNLPRGMIFMPMGPAANRLVGDETQSTGMPSFKGIEAEVAPA